MRAAEARAAAASVEPAPGLPSMDLAAYRGRYLSGLLGTITIDRQGGGVVLRMGEGEEADLLPLNRDTFTVRWRDRVIGEDNDTRITFALDGDGRVARLSMQVRRDLIEATRPSRRPATLDIAAAVGSARPCRSSRGRSPSELVTG